MKRRLLNHKSLKQAALAVPAAALMLGAAQAGTTIGLNLQAWYYDSGATPQTIGFGYGYQTTGFPVTARAFGLNVGNWSNSDPLPCNVAGFTATVPFGSGLSANINAANMWQSGWTGPGVQAPWIPGDQVAAMMVPGNYEATWGMLDNTGWQVDLSGMAAKFPSGYVIELIGAGKTKTTSVVEVTNLVNSAALASVTFTVLPDGMGLGSTPTLTSDNIRLYNDSRNVSSARCCAMGGFIITDQPAVTSTQGTTTVNQGSTLTLNARVIGVGSISYQWQHAGTNYPGATTVPFSKTATADDTGDWALVATSLYGTTTSDVIAVTVNQAPLFTENLSPVTNNVYSGFITVLSVIAAGAEPLTYQWEKNGVPIADATNASFAVTNTTAGLSGYSVTVNNTYGSAGSLTNYLNVVAAPDSYTTVVGADGPVSYWPLGETTATVAYDYAGFGHDGNQVGGLTSGVTGPRPPTFPGFSGSKTAYQFDGTTSYVTPGTSASLAGATDFSVEAWVNTTTTVYAPIIHQRDTGNGYNGAYRVGVNGDGTVYFAIYNNGWQFSFSSAAKVNDGNWHHVVAVRSGMTGNIYVDGALAGSASGPVVNLDPALVLHIGHDPRDNVDFFGGAMANVAIYDKALTASQVIKHYANASGAVFKLTLSPGGMVEDSKPAGTPHHGQGHSLGWANSVTDTAVPPVTRNGVAQFAAASGSQVVMPANADFDSASGTIMFWLRVPIAALPGPGSEGAMLVDHRLTAGAVIVLNDAGAIFFQGQGGSRNSLTAGYLVDDAWHHVAVTYGQTTNDWISIYIDGTLNNLVQVTNAWSWPAAQQIEIGKSHDGYWKRFDGQMDDFRIYNRILNDSEIASVKASDALVDTSALKVRYNFGTAAGVGQTVTWTFGTLMSSPTLGPSAVWTPVPGAVSPYAFLPTESSMFFRAEY